jgi:lysine 2,3-aminomutase
MTIPDGAEALEPPNPGAARTLLDPHLNPTPQTRNGPPPETNMLRLVDRRERFPESESSRRFRKRFFSAASQAEWSDWRWQMRSRIRALADLERVFHLTDSERAAVQRRTGALPVGITPYYAGLLSRDDPSQGLRRTHIPVNLEFVRLPGEAADPLGEDHDSAVPGLVHRYPDRVLFLATGTCSTYCRYCTRAHAVGNPGGEYSFNPRQWEAALEYVAAHTEIRDVLISGGDPLTLADEKLDYLLGRLKTIRHVEFVRIGSKVPVVLPMRVTRQFLKIMRRHRPVWLSVHAAHPDELTPEVTEAFARLADSGVPLGSQTVLLKGVNDDLATMKRLMHGLLQRRVRPYYLYQCDPISGSGHFRTPVQTGLEIIRGLRGRTTGYAVPHFVVDAPGGGGKIALLPDAVAGRDGDDLLLTNYEGAVYRYPDPDGTLGAEPWRAAPCA